MERCLQGLGDSVLKVPQKEEVPAHAREDYDHAEADFDAAEEKPLKNSAETASLPIVVVTARGELVDRIKGLELGADDYLTKPFNLRELVLRIRALLRRSLSGPQEVLEIGAFQINKSKFEIRVEGSRLALTTAEFRLLTLLIERRGRTQSREILLSDALGYHNSIMTRTVDTHIRRLRGKLGNHAGRLETVRTEGYRFNPVLGSLPADADAERASKRNQAMALIAPAQVSSTFRPWKWPCEVCQSSSFSVPQAPTSRAEFPL